MELDALPPNVLQEVVRENIEELMDLSQFGAEVAKEQAEQAKLGQLLSTV